MAKVLLLRSSEGKVLVAPTWDNRRTALARPLQTGVPSRALERVVQFWTKHALAEVSGEPLESLAAWDANFLRRLHHDGLTMEIATAARQLRLNDDLAEMLSDFALVGRSAVSTASHARAATRADVAAAARADLAVAWCAAGADHATAVRAARSDPVRAWCAAHARVDPAASPDHAAASRARGRQQAEEEEEESACHHRKRPMAVTLPAAAPRLPVPEAAALLKVTAPAQLHPSKPAASSLRARRGLPELSCKCPKQSLLAGSRRLPA